jgi:hypothetical protein
MGPAAGHRTIIFSIGSVSKNNGASLFYKKGAGRLAAAACAVLRVDQSTPHRRSRRRHIRKKAFAMANAFKLSRPAAIAAECYLTGA